MRVTLRVDGVVTAERHGYGTDGVRPTFADGRPELVPGARIARADAD